VVPVVLAAPVGAKQPHLKSNRRSLD